MSNKNENIFIPDTDLALRLANRLMYDLQEVQTDCEKCMREHFRLTDRQIELLREGKTISEIKHTGGSYDKN
jgi:hypothetical protein